jgi:AmiR/NasT family two-component response regulator
MVAANLQTLRAVVAGGQTGSVADRLTALGYDVVAHVGAGREAIDAARRLTPDAVLFETELSDGLGVLAAQAVTRATPGIAALILSVHPAAANRDARPHWGPVSLMAADAAEAELDAEVRDAVARARALAQLITAEPVPLSNEVDEDPIAEVDDLPAVALADIADEELYDLGAAVLDDEPVAEPELLAEPELAEPVLLVEPALLVEPELVAEPELLDESDESLIDRAVAAVAERAGLSASDALRLMEQEADDNGQSLHDVAVAMLSDEPA